MELREGNYPNPETYHSMMLNYSGEPKENYTGVTSSIAMTTTYHFPSEPSHNNFYYSRTENPNYSELEAQFSILHGGSSAVAFASGMAAISSVILNCSKKRVIVYSNEIYNDLISWMEREFGTTSMVVDITSTEEVLKVLKTIGKDKVGLLYFESLSNPSCKIPDFLPLLTEVKTFDAEIIVAIDNTLLSPSLFRPFDLPPIIIKDENHSGKHFAAPLVDLVIESATKYLSGKADVLLGIVCIRKRIEGYYDEMFNFLSHRLSNWRTMGGGAPSPFSCWLCSKGLETLPLRMKAKSRTTIKLVTFLETMPFITRVTYPSSSSLHPHYDRTKYFYKKMAGALFRFHISAQMFGSEYSSQFIVYPPLIHAVSFGDSHTLLYPKEGASSPIFSEDATHLDLKRSKKFGVWIRVSVGLQSSSDIIRSFIFTFLKNDYLYVKYAVIKKFSPSSSSSSSSSNRKDTGKSSSSSSSTSVISFSQIKSNYTMEITEKDIFFMTNDSFDSILFITFLSPKLNAKNSQITTKLIHLNLTSKLSENTIITKGAPLFCFKNLSFTPPSNNNNNNNNNKK